MTPQRRLKPEEALQGAVIDLARNTGWLVAHFRPAKTERGWRTAVSGDGKGYPDLTLLRGGEQLVAELKSDTGRLSPEQRVWLEAFERAGVEAHVWRPRDWADIEARLKQPRVPSGT